MFVLCGKNKDNLSVFKGFLRNVITAPYEGRYWQSGLYLYGAGGTSKNLWAEVFQKFVPQENIQEFNRYQTQYSAGQLEKCQLFIVSDVIQLTKKQIDVLKRILGRDNISYKIKYSSEFG